MCVIKFINREKENVTDSNIDLSGINFELIDKPYFITRVSEELHEIYEFKYQDEKEAKNEHPFGSLFVLEYGKTTFRLYKLTLSSNGARIPNKDWSDFENHIKQNSSLNNGKNDSLLQGIKAVRYIYQNVIFVKENNND